MGDNARLTRAAPAGFVLAGLGASSLGSDGQLAFALVAVLGIGMLHGISDLALVDRQRHTGFLAGYLVVAAAVLAWWRLSPETALAGFLIASVAHFGLENAPAARPAERCCRGLLMVAGPTLLHQAAIAGLFVRLTASASVAGKLATALMVAALAGLALLMLAMIERRRTGASGTGALLVGLAALLLLPPLAGFSIGFVLLHAGPELRERMAVLGSESVVRYVDMDDRAAQLTAGDRARSGRLNLARAKT